MHLCTLFPFGPSAPDSWPPDGVATLEANITPVWRNGELRFVHPSSGLLIVRIDTVVHQEFLNLLTTARCVKLTAVMRTAQGSAGPALVEPLAVRVCLLKDAFASMLQGNVLATPNFLAIESILATTLAKTPYAVESGPESKRRRTAWDLTARTIEVPTSAEVCDGLHWSFETLAFERQRVVSIKSVSIRPTVLVSGACDYWQEGILQTAIGALQSSGPRRRAKAADGPSGSGAAAGPSGGAAGTTAGTGGILVVTEASEPWASAATAAGLSPVCITGTQGLLEPTDSTVVIVTPGALATQMHAKSDLEDLAHEAIQLTTTTVRNATQTRRVIDGLRAKFQNFPVPIGLHTFGLCILDSPGPLRSEGALQLALELPAARTLQVVRDLVQTRPRALTRDQMVQAVDGLSRWATPHAARPLEPHVLVMPLPKHITRRLKAFRHPVKNSAVEDRIAKYFRATNCPLKYSEAVQRFSAKNVPPEVAEASLDHHFGRLSVSLGTFLEAPVMDPTQPVAFSLRPDYVKRALHDDLKACCVCFEPLAPSDANSDGLYEFTICGHAYCRECSVHLFVSDWAALRAKPCAQCRTPLIPGDVFSIQTAWRPDAPFSPALASKQQCIAGFLGSLKADAIVWDTSATDEPPPGTKHVVVPEFTEGLAFKIVRGLYGATNSVGLHMFFTPQEQAAAEAVIAAL